MIDPDLPASAILSPEEAAEYYRAKRNRALSCSDGMCGGCPSCLEAQGVSDDDETEECPCCVAQRDAEAYQIESDETEGRSC